MKIEKVSTLEKREEYRLKMVELQNEAQHYRDVIENFDKGIDEEKRKNLLGKCFHNEYTWMRIDGFREEDYRAYGIIISDFSESVKDDLPIFQIEINSAIWDDDIDKFTEISIDEFQIKLTDIVNCILIATSKIQS